PLLLLLQAYRTFRKEDILSEPDYLLIATRFFSWFFVFVCACGLLSIHFIDNHQLPAGSGGILGMEVARFSVSSFNVLGASLILFALLLVFVSFAGNL